MSQSSKTTVTKITAAAPATKTVSHKGAATKDAGRVHVGGSMIRF